MAAGKVIINGVDIRDTYGADVYEFPDPPSPTFSMRVQPEFDAMGSPKRVTQEIEAKTLSMRFSLSLTDNYSIQVALQNIGALIGWHGTGNKDVSVVIKFSTAAGVDYGNQMEYRCICEDFQVEYMPPVHVQTACVAVIRFKVLEAIAQFGTTTQTLVVPAASNLINSVYFEDTNCVNGSTPMRVQVGTAGSYSIFMMWLLAHGNDIVYPMLGVSRTGNVAITAGQFGQPAISIAASGAYLMYDGLQSLAFRNNRQISVGVRFKRNYASNDATNKYLFQDAGAPLSIHIAATTQDVVLTFPGGTISLSGSAISNTNWNAVMATIDDAGAALYLYTGAQTSAANGPGNPVTTPSAAVSAFIVGNSAAGTGPCKCLISEVAVYKMGLSTTATSAWVQATNSTRRLFKYDLCRNLTFLLDFTNGFEFACNQGMFVQCSGIFSSGEQVHFDSQRRALRKYTVASGAYSDITGELQTYRRYGLNFEAQQYNKLVLGAATSGNTTYWITYEPRRRR